MRIAQLLFLAALASFLTLPQAFALDPHRAITQYASDVLRTSDGLPQNSVQAITQTQDGYLWFGTQEGVVRFDGVRFSVFDKHNTPALRHNSIQSLTEASNGDLWFGTFVGGVTRLRNGVFTSLTQRDGLSSDQVKAVYQDRDGSLWIGTNEGLDHLVGDKITNYSTENGLRNDQILTLLQDRDGYLWIGTNGGGVARYRAGSFEWFDTQGGLAGDQVRAIWQSRNGDLWFGSYGGGASRLSGGTWTRFSKQDGLASNQISDIREDRDGNVWFATSGGVSRWREGKFATLDTGTNLAIALFEDREGSLWIGSNGGGVTRLRDAKVINYTTVEGLTAGSARSVLQAQNGAIWIGTDEGLSILQDGQVRQLSAPQLKARVFALNQDSSGAVWAGTHGSGAFRLEGEQITAFGVAQGLSNNVVRAILSARDGATYVGTDIGLNRIESGTIKSWRRKDGMSADQVMALLEASDGALWIATNGGGLNRWRDGRFTAITSKEGLGSDVVFALYESQDGAIWAGTDGGGLCRVQGTAVGCVTSKHGLYDDLVVQILDDQRGKLWMSSNRGVFNATFNDLEAVATGRLDKLTSTRFDTSDGMASAECHGGSQPSGARSQDGRLWFPTLEGVAVFDPAKAFGNTLPPPVRIEAFVVDGMKREVDRGVAANHKQVEIHYTALSFVNPDAVAFKYRLTGFNDEWVDAQTRRAAYFTNLPPGDYDFQVIASNSDGVWNEEGAKLSFTRRARWDETVWFRLVAALLTVGLLALAFRFLSMRHRARQAELERLVSERTQQLAQSNAELGRLAITDALTGVFNRRGANETLESYWQCGAAAQTPLAVLMIDIDFFKAYNDHYGHIAGDVCLKAVASLLAQVASQTQGFLARVGGEEFLLLLSDSNLASAVAIAERMRSQVELAALPHAKATGRSLVTVSVGAASVIPNLNKTSQELIKAADQALYSAKKSGRNRVSAGE